MENKKIKMLKTHNALISFNKTKFTLPKYSLGAVYIFCFNTVSANAGTRRP